MIDIATVNDRFDEVAAALTRVNDHVGGDDGTLDFVAHVNELRGALVRMDGALATVLADLVRRESQ